MKGWKVLFQEFVAIVRNKKILIPVIGVLFIPVLYAGMFLWAFWDPYEKLTDLPVAVVNLDKGATYEGEKLHVGKDLVKELKNNDSNESFGWDFVSLEEAKKGFKDRKYYMMIQIPEDFSKNVTTLRTENPTKLELFYIPNESLNFLSSQIGESGMAKIKAELQETITKTYAEKVFGEVAKGLNEASDGAEKLNDGSIELKDGSVQLKDGLITLVDKSKEFQDGLTAAKNGSGQLKDGLGTLASKTPELSQGINQLKDGSSQLKNGLADATLGSTKIQDGLVSVDGGLAVLQGKVEKELIPGSNQLLKGSEALATGLKDASDGANKLNNSMPVLVGGSSQVSQGAAAVSQGLTDFEVVINQLTAGLPEEQKQAIKAKYAELQKGSQQVKSGAALVAGGLQEAKPGVEKLAAGQKQLLAGANDLHAGQQSAVGGVNQLAAGVKELHDGSSALVVGSKGLNEGVGKLSVGSTDLDNGLGLLKSNATTLISGVNALRDGSVALDKGVGQLKDGSGALIDGVGQLKDGSVALTDGLTQVEDGTKELKTKLKESAVEADNSKGNDKELSMLANPVEVKTEKVGAVPNYGTGFAPYFLSLGLFVGALLISIVFPLRESFGTARTAFGRLASKSAVLMVVGIIQALIVVAILVLGLGMDVQSLPKFIGFSILTSWTFLALVQFFVTVFGDVGRFLAIIVLILQLTTSAGTFPLELVPNALQTFNSFLPMTYSVSGLKAVISSGDYTFMWQNAVVLCGFIAIMLAGTYAYFLVTKKRMNAKEAPIVG